MPLFPQQLACVRRFRELSHAFNLSDFGTGKSATAVVRLRDLCPPHRALILAPASKVDDWVDELEKWGRPGWQIAVLGGSTVRTRRKRLRSFTTGHHVAVLNFEGLRVMGRLLLPHYQVLVVDEVQVAKNPTSVISRGLAYLSDRMPYSYGLTGSPVTERLTDAYGVIRAIAPAAIDATFERWLSRLFVYESRKDKLGRRQYPAWHPRDGAAEEIAALLRSLSYRCTRQELPVEWPDEIDAPPIRVRLSGDVRRAYQTLEKDLRLHLAGADATARNIRPKLQKLLQLTAGWVYNDLHRPIAVGRSEKLRALTEHVEEVRHAGQLLIWSVYPPEVRMIGRALDRMGVKHALCYGDIDPRERERAKSMFNDGYLGALVANPKIWGPSVNLYAHYATTFSRDWSGELFGQKRGRPLRADSTQSKVTFTEIVAADTMDERCLEALREKRDLLADLLRLRSLPVPARKPTATHDAAVDSQLTEPAQPQPATAAPSP